MTNEQIDQIIQGVGVMTELWTITFKNFKSQGMNDTDAVIHTKAFMSIMVGSILGNGGGEVT